MSSGAIRQISTAISSHPVFVGATTVWSNEEQPTNCGPGGCSAPDGKVNVHDLQTDHETTIQLPDFAGNAAYSFVDLWVG